ncbi:MAG: pyridoxal-phosphate-dependent aminotransferase family protein [Methyloligellaceae bacterium]
MIRATGRHFLQVPGPSNVPESVLLAIAKSTIDHRGPEFQELTRSILQKFEQIFDISDPVVLYPSSGTGAWTAALSNCLSPGDRVLAFETGHFAVLWKNIATDLGLDIVFEHGDWGAAIDPGRVETLLREDKEHRIKAVCIVHNETSTGVETNIGDVRHAMDASQHPALLLVDAVSSLGSLPYKHTEWRVDVTISGSQKGLMLPPGIGINIVSDKAREFAKHGSLPKAYWDWEPMVKSNKDGFYPYTPPTNLMFGLEQALTLMLSETIDEVYRRHQRHGEATRAAVQAWGLETVCSQTEHHSNVTTALMMPDNINADEIRKIALERFNVSLGTGLGKLSQKAFRIGHLGDCNDLMLTGTLTGVEMALDIGNVPIQAGGVTVAMNKLKSG